ncbi:unnamed protein product [Cylindrotheca closterium]|uniref:Uncharacterized protein n=1 Tax=Cylindrotheca closterium TaxID=2856 RepID=A0AAD2JJ64_9STRA|nr:unnamed protein product [Cylindrotheca closterium]
MDRSYTLWKKRYLVHVPAEGQGHVRCSLCNTGTFNINASNPHFQGNRHRKRLQAVFNSSNLTIFDGPELLDRVSKLGFEGWKDDINSKLMEYLFVKGTPRWPYGQNQFAFPTSIVDSVVKYERMEVASLLELVAWKLNCLHLNGSGNFMTMQDILDQWAIDESFDPVEYKRQHRFSSNVGIIMDRLLEFLW